MCLLYFIISCEDLRPPLYIRFRHTLFSFVVVDIMYSFPFAVFHTWEGSGLVQPEMELSRIVLSLYHFYLLGVQTSWMSDGTMLRSGITVRHSKIRISYIFGAHF